MKFKKPLHVGAPNIGSRKLFNQLADEMFERHWLTNNGELVLRFEEELKEYLGVKHCITTCNGTTALEFALRALGLKGEVILPSLTFIATAHALEWNGIKPVFCDVDPVSLCIDPAEVEKLITPSTTGILGVHLFGHPCATTALTELANKHQLKLMFDAAHAFGTSLDGKRIGGFGECEIFSFHATKMVNSFEGGAIATNNDKLAHKARLMRNFGFEETTGEVVQEGVNGKMTEICAAMGITNLREIENFLTTNRENLQAYKEGLDHIPFIRLIGSSSESNNDRFDLNHHYVAVEIMNDFPLSRDDLMEKMRAENVLVRRYFWPGCHRSEPYQSFLQNKKGTLPITESILERILLLPTGNTINTETIKCVLELIRECSDLE